MRINVFKIRIPIFWIVWISQRISECFVDQLVPQRLLGYWKTHILKDRNQQVSVSRHRIWLCLLRFISTKIWIKITLASFSCSMTLTILPNDGMTLILILLKLLKDLPVLTDCVLEWHDSNEWYFIYIFIDWLNWS